MPATYEPIATTTLGSAAATITFSSIPATYTDLRLVLVGSLSTAGTVAIRFNSDSASNYSNTWLFGYGATANSTRYSNTTLIRAAYLNSSNPSMLTADIFSYAGSTNKTMLSMCSDDRNGSGSVDVRVSLWRNTSAISSITITELDGYSYAIGTTATLYGILKA